MLLTNWNQLVDLYLKNTEGYTYRALIGGNPLYTSSEKFSYNYFNVYYRERATYNPFVCFCKEWIFFNQMTADHDLIHGVEALQDLLNNHPNSSKRKESFETYQNSLLTLYTDTLTYANIAKMSDDELTAYVKIVQHDTRHMNASVWYASILTEDTAKKALAWRHDQLLSWILENRYDLSLMITPTFEAKQQLLYSQYLVENPWASLDAIHERFEFVNTSYSHWWTVDEAQKYIDEHFGDIESIVKNIGTSWTEKWENFKRMCASFSEEQKKVAQYMQDTMQYRDQKKFLTMHGLTLLYRLWRELCSRAQIEHKFLDYIMFYELCLGIEYLKSVKEHIIQREKWFVCYTDYYGNTAWWHVDNYEEIYELFKSKHTTFETSNAKEVVTIKWSVGSVWYAEWTVYVLTENMDPSTKVPPGSVIVSINTRPEIVRYLKDAIAIVTDEGWITCHAAVVSRELGIPCVVWTKFASYMLKTGQKVIVDAKQWIITVVG